MTNEQFQKIYSNCLMHAWATSKDPTKYAQQKQKEKEYNHQYYESHKNGGTDIVTMNGKTFDLGTGNTKNASIGMMEEGKRSLREFRRFQKAAKPVKPFTKLASAMISAEKAKENLIYKISPKTDTVKKIHEVAQEMYDFGKKVVDSIFSTNTNPISEMKVAGTKTMKKITKTIGFDDIFDDFAKG